MADVAGEMGRLRDEGDPERLTVKDGLRDRATGLRGDGWSVNDIALELGVARSTAWRWVGHLPLDPDSDRARRKREHAKIMTNARWENSRTQLAERRAAATAAASDEVDRLTDRELLLVGAAVYWCEGAKAKPWNPEERLIFSNGDAGLIRLFLRFLALAGVTKDRVAVRLYIHETADIEAAERWWGEQTGLGREQFLRTSLKRHSSSTARGNTGAGYHGCLAVSVRRGRELYWRIQGMVDAMCRSTVSGVISTEDVR